MTQDMSHRVLALVGAHSVRQAAQTHAQFLAVLREPGDVLLDCSGVTEADLSLVQIILAAHRSAVAGGRHFALAAPPEAALLSALQRGGFAQRDATDPARWIGRESAP